MNEIIVDKTHKENISYIENMGSHSKLPIGSVTLSDMYDFVKDDLSLASYTQIVEEDISNMSSFEFLGETIEQTKQDPYIETELGFLGQDLENSTNAVKDLVVDSEKSKRFNIAMTCNQNNYINVLAGALKIAINKIENLEKQLNNQ